MQPGGPAEQSANAWPRIPREFAAVLRPRIDVISREMIETIARELPDYRKPADSPFGHDFTSAVKRALHDFADLVEDPRSPRADNALFFRGLGKAEYRNGRSLDLLQAAYRIGARVGCRCYIQLAQDAGLSTETVLVLSEAVLIHINALANESVKGYAAAREHNDGDRLGRDRRALAERLLERRPTGGAPLSGLAARAEWPLPAAVACVLTTPAEQDAFDRDVLVLPRGPELVLVLPDTAIDDSLAAVRARLRERQAVLGPTVPLAEAWLSLHCARSVNRLVQRKMVPPSGDGMVSAADHLSEVMLTGNEPLGRLLAQRTVSCLTDLSRGKATRLEETLDALLSSWGRTAPEVAEALGVHPQTARNRMRQLESLLGDRLSDPSFRLEAQVVLRLRALLRTAGEPVDRDVPTRVP